MSVDAAIERIDALLDGPVDPLVRGFYDPDFAAQHSATADFVGEAFTTLGANPRDSFEASDLIAVHMMGMTFRPTTVRALLKEGEERKVVEDLLSQIPDNADIWSDGASFEVADELWRRLTSEKRVYRGIDAVTAGKLLARKRPRLIPIVDDVVVDLVPRPSNGYWDLFRRYLRRPGSVKRVESLRPTGLSPDTTPTLRLLDTAIWMRGSRGRGAREVRQRFGFSDLR